MEKTLPICSMVGNQLQIQFAGKKWLLDHSRDIDQLWSQLNEYELADERIPYWAELWPSSLALARLLQAKKEEIWHQPCLDLGCGLGFTGLVGQFLGASVIGCDYTLRALQTARQHSKINSISLSWVAMDWRDPAVKKGSIWRIWAADILYERRAMRPVLNFLQWSLSAGGKAWLAEPGRSVFGHFVELAHQGNWGLEQVAETTISGVKAGDKAAHIIIWEATPPVAKED